MCVNCVIYYKALKLRIATDHSGSAVIPAHFQCVSHWKRDVTQAADLIGYVQSTSLNPLWATSVVCLCYNVLRVDVS